MKCQGKFKMREMKRRDGGSFTNSQGKVINYQPSYALKVDEITEEGIYERVFKISEDSVLIPQLAQIKPYQDITLSFEVQFYGSCVKITPIALIN